MPTRRHFLQLTAAGAAISLAARRTFAADSTAFVPAEKKSLPFELGLADYTLHKFPLDKALAMTNRVGLKHICIHPIHVPMKTPADKAVKIIEQVKAAGLDPYACGVVYMKTEQEVEQAFEFVKAAGLKLIVGVPVPAVLPLVNEKVKQLDIRVAVHNHGPGDKVYPTPDSAYESIKNLDSRIGLCIDIGHTARNGVDPSLAAEKFADRLFDVHIKDMTEATAKGRCLETGRGVIDIPKFIRTLKRINYSGKVSFEYEKDMTDPIVGLAESVGYVRGVMAATI